LPVSRKKRACGQLLDVAPETALKEPNVE
jgi:hypothetical protein